MQSQFLSYLRGYVGVRIRGERIEAFLNRAVEQRMAVWDIRRENESSVRLYLSLGDFFKLRALLKETGCRSRVLERRGFPFYALRLYKRKFFFIGLAGFIVGMYMLSSLVWQVDVEGNETLPKYEILQAARDEGIYRLQWKFRLKELSEISRTLHGKLPGTSWVGVEMQGTRIVIKVVESARPEPRELLSPRHLVAAKSAMITAIRSTKGKPVVKPNTVVRKGDVLISGVIGEGEHQQVVPAEGQVKGIVWYESDIEVPLTQYHKVYTGESFGRFYLVFGSRALQVTGYGKQAYELAETISSRKTLQWRQYSLPIGWMNEKVLEALKSEESLDEPNAKALGIERAKNDLLAQADSTARMVSSKVLQEKIENGKVLMKVHFEIEESIGEELAIVPGQ